MCNARLALAARLTAQAIDVDWLLSQWGIDELCELPLPSRDCSPAWARFRKPEEVHDGADSRLSALLRKQSAATVERQLWRLTPDELRIVRIEYVWHRHESQTRRARAAKMPMHVYALTLASARAKIASAIE